MLSELNEEIMLYNLDSIFLVGILYLIYNIGGGKLSHDVIDLNLLVFRQFLYEQS